MRANYSTRRTSVVLNPRGRVFGGLGENGDGGDGGYGGGYDGGYDGGYASFSTGNDGSSQDPGEGGSVSFTTGYTFSDANAISNQDAISQSIAALANPTDAANEAAAALAYASVAEQAAALNAAAVTTAAQSLAATKASNATSAKTVATIANTLLGFFGPLGMLAGLVSRATGFIENAVLNNMNNPTAFNSDLTNAQNALNDARGYAGDNAIVNNEINKIQTNLDIAKKAGIEIAVTQMYQTYAKRNPDPAALAYWSQRFGPTITADEVLQFQQFLYANEPNLRPVVTQTASQSSNNLALPIIAAVAGFLIFGA